MAAGDEHQRAALLAVADRLAAELGNPAAEDLPDLGDWLVSGGGATVGILSSEDEELVSGMRRSLAQVAAALAADSGDGLGIAVGAALDGAEAVIRGELLLGNADRLPAMIPGFVFVVVLPVVDQDRALELSRRTARIVERAMGR